MNITEIKECEHIELCKEPECEICFKTTWNDIQHATIMSIAEALEDDKNSYSEE